MSVVLSPVDLAGVVARALGDRAAWVSPELVDPLAAVGVASTRSAEVAVVAADAVTPDGRVVGASGVVPRTSTVWAWLRGSRLRVRAVASTSPRVDRIFFGLGVLEVRDEGLVLVAVAPDVSARDVQHRADGRLWVAPTLRTIERSR